MGECIPGNMIYTRAYTRVGGTPSNRVHSRSHDGSLPTSRYFACVFETGKFSTLPEPDADSDESFGIVAFSVRGLGRVTAATEHRDDIEAACAAVMAVDPKICVVLGEPATQGTGR